MKSIFKKNTIIINSFILLFGVSCDRFSDVGLPKNQITRDVVFKDDQLARSAMAGVYRSIESAGFLSGSASGVQVVLGAYVDELQSYAAASSDASIFYQLSHMASTTKISSLWSATYTQLYNINSVIEGLEASDNISPELRMQLKGEALFLRAILHLYLSQTFGNVPFVNSTNYDINKSISKSEVNQVYTYCKADLDLAINLLPETLPVANRIYPTKIAAYTVLARIAYYEKDWDTAIKYSNLVINNPQYKIETDLNKVFLKESTSSIWHLLPFSETYNASQGSVFILTNAPPTNVALRQDFVDDFEIGDARKLNWIGQKTDAQNKTYYYPFKYKLNSRTTTSLEYSVILRLEELFLIRAEAYIQKTQYALAQDDINKIRIRAGLSALPNSNDPNLLMIALMKERKFELFTEFGHRFYDLKQHNLLDDVMLSKKPAWKSDFKLLPLPEKELLINPNLNPQNHGY